MECKVSLPSWHSYDKLLTDLLVKLKSYAENTGAIDGTSGQQSQKRISTKCGTSCNMRGSETQMTGKTYMNTLLAPQADEERP